MCSESSCWEVASPGCGAHRRGAEARRDWEGTDAVDVTLVNRDAFHSIRVRNYESELIGIRVPLDDVLEPVGVRRLEGEAVGIDPSGRAIRVNTANGRQTLAYDRLVFAPGSQLVRPDIPGLADIPSMSTPMPARPGSTTTCNRCPSGPNRRNSSRSSWWAPD